MNIAVVSCAIASGMSDDDPILLAALDRAGHQAQLCYWHDEHIDWSSFDVALVRSTWDYFQRAEQFVPWLQQTRKQVRFINDAAILEWNLDKRYLLELLEAGVHVVPTQVADAAGLDAALVQVWDSGNSAIVKPVVSGGAWGLHHLQPGETFAVNHSQAPWLVQPFVPSIVESGELSVILLGGDVSHGIRKLPGSGDIRVQREHGGRYLVEDPSDEACALAQQVLAACPGAPMYARADMVEREGKLALMEIELLEPELFFAMVPAAADRLAEHIG